MYKNLSIAVLLVAFGLVAARSTGTPATTSTPTIIKKAVFQNQSAPIPTTTLFTPGAVGLFRVTICMIQTIPNPSGNYWVYHLAWSDDAGSETTLPNYGAIWVNSTQTPPIAWGGNAYAPGVPGSVVILQANAGQPVTFSVTGVAGSAGTYSLYFTVEQLI
jgi:hypothetical protein